MSPAEWKHAPEWERELLIRGLVDEFGGDGARRSAGDGDGSLDGVPPELMRHLS